MAKKNLMSEVAKMLGVEIGERFKVSKKDSEIYYFTDAAFLKQVNDAESEDFVSDLEEEDLLVLYYLLSGKETVVRLPWEPNNGDRYYAMLFADDTKPSIDWYLWSGCIEDYAYKKLGIIHKTEEEAKSHMAEDYERLTGKKLEK